MNITSLNFLNNLDNLSVKLRWLDHYKYSPQPMHISRASNPYSIFWIILSGRRELCINNVTYELSEGNVVCIPPHCQRTDLSVTGESDMEYLVVGCDFKIGLFNMLDCYQFPVVSTVTDSQDWEQLQRLWHRMDNCGKSLLQELQITDHPICDGSTFIMLNMHQTLIYLRINAILIEWLEIIMKNVIPVLPDVIDERIHSACSYIDQELGRPILSKPKPVPAVISQITGDESYEICTATAIRICITAFAFNQQGN
jgi:hypothetical protein